MIRVRLTCLDIILFSAFAYAISDGIKNWALYSTCTVPIHIYIIVSVATLFLVRFSHFLGY
jgi:hypothetical protein